MLTAASSSDHVFEVTADYVNITGFTAKGATSYRKAGIYLGGAEHCDISDNKASNNYYGIFLLWSSNNNLTGNTFVNDGLFVHNSYHNTVENNTVNGKPLVYLEDTSDYMVPDAGQVILVNCNNVTVENRDLSNSTVGVELWETTNSTITNNTASNNNYAGIYLESSSNNTLTNNNANSNNQYGIHLSSSSNYNTLTNNTANSNNGDGIHLSSSSNNLTNNTANSNNDYGIYLCSSNNTLNNNTMSGNTVHPEHRHEQHGRWKTGLLLDQSAR
jgi:parallel beta-helix repeat protein